MTVRRIVATIFAADPTAAKSFYEDVLGLDAVMDHGWIRTYASPAAGAAQVSIASQGGSGTPVPDISVEVDDLDEVLKRLHEAGLSPEYGPADEPWGVRRLYIRDPFGKLVNILQHL